MGSIVMGNLNYSVFPIWLGALQDRDWGYVIAEELPGISRRTPPPLDLPPVWTIFSPPSSPADTDTTALMTTHNYIAPATIFNLFCNWEVHVEICTFQNFEVHIKSFCNSQKIEVHIKICASQTFGIIRCIQLRTFQPLQYFWIITTASFSLCLLLICLTAFRTCHPRKYFLITPTAQAALFSHLSRLSSIRACGMGMGILEWDLERDNLPPSRGRTSGLPELLPWSSNTTSEPDQITQGGETLR